jgi:hypothetical protein
MGIKVELPDEMVERWLKGDGKESDDEIILAAIHHAKKEKSDCKHVVSGTWWHDVEEPPYILDHCYCPKCGEKV